MSNTRITTLFVVPADVLLELVVVMRTTQTLHVTSESEHKDLTLSCTQTYILFAWPKLSLSQEGKAHLSNILYLLSTSTSLWIPMLYIECNGHRLFVQCSAAQCDGNWKQSEGSPVDRAGLFWLLESSRLKLYPLYSLNCTAVQWCSVHSTVLPCAVQQSEFSHSIHRICCRKC